MYQVATLAIGGSMEENKIWHIVSGQMKRIHKFCRYSIVFRL